MPKNAPVLSLIALGLFVIGAVAIIATGHGEDGGGALLVGMIVSTVPSLIAAMFAERSSRDIRNGTVTEKSRVGTHQALVESGVKAAVDASPPEATAAAYQALVRLLERDHVERVDIERAAVPVAQAVEQQHERSEDGGK